MDDYVESLRTTICVFLRIINKEKKIILFGYEIEIYQPNLRYNSLQLEGFKDDAKDNLRTNLSF